VRPLTLDHVALWVSDVDSIADFAIAHAGMHVITRTDAFTLVGPDARRGKLTLFAADGPRERGPLEHVGLRVTDLERALRALPPGLEIDRPHAREAYFDAGEGLRLGLIEADTETEYDLDHVALRATDPVRTAREYRTRFGFEAAAPGPSGAERVEVGGAFVEFHESDGAASDRPLLNHVGVLVESADESVARELGMDVADVVDAANTFAVFVWAPDGVKLEYVEHKPTFSLV
jgi:catechol 2,3-dioxygenase-like lactoylglutathione lyase family enzyme